MTGTSKVLTNVAGGAVNACPSTALTDHTAYTH